MVGDHEFHINVDFLNIVLNTGFIPTEWCLGIIHPLFNNKGSVSDPDNSDPDILLLPLVARCLETIDVCIWRMLVSLADVRTVWGSKGMFVVQRPLQTILYFSLGVLKYVVCLCSGCDGCCIFCLYCEAWSYRCLCMGSVRVSSCRCSMFVSSVHPVVVLNVAFCMTCIFSCWSRMKEATMWNIHTPDPVS